MRKTTRLLALALYLTTAPGCAESDESEPGEAGVAAASSDSSRVWLEIGSEPFELELALDPTTRHRGLSGRASIPRNAGMLFVFPEPRPLAFVMRECRVPIDIAFLDISGRVLAIHEMEIEPPRRPDEAPAAYEARLPGYPSGAPASFAVEIGGGRLREVGLQVGQRLRLGAQQLIQRAR